MAKRKNKNINQEMEKYRKKYEVPEAIEPTEYKHKDLAPINRRFCAYHPVTQIIDCLKCEAPCTVLGNLLTADVEKRVSKELRDEIWEYFYSGDSPLVKLAELTGITLTVELVRQDTMWAPHNIKYLKTKDKVSNEIREMNFDEFYDHMRLFYQGRLAWQALGTLVQAGLILSQIPDTVRNLAAYYEFHRDAMQGKIDPEKKMLIDEVKDSLPRSEDKTLEFEDVDSAIRFYIQGAMQILMKEKELTGDELIDAVNTFVRFEMDKQEVP